MDWIHKELEERLLKEGYWIHFGKRLREYSREENDSVTMNRDGRCIHAHPDSHAIIWINRILRREGKALKIIRRNKNSITWRVTIKSDHKPHVVVLLDASGSMLAERDSVVSTFNEYVQSVKETAKTISLYTFDSKGLITVFKGQKPDTVKPLTIKDYKPDAMTPLYDSMAQVINLWKNSERNVQFVVHTDGIENTSKEWSFKALSCLIDDRTEDGWLFVYLGEGLDGRVEMAKFAGVKVNFSSQNRKAAMDTIADVTEIYTTTGLNTIETYTKSSDGAIEIDH